MALKGKRRDKNKNKDQKPNLVHHISAQRKRKYGPLNSERQEEDKKDNRLTKFQEK